MRNILFFTIILFFVACKPNPNVYNLTRKTDLPSNRYNVAILIMDGVYNTELIAPYDIFQHTVYRQNIKPMNVFLVANTLDPIRAFEGNYHIPDFNYLTDKIPHIDILVVPSAEHHLDTDLEDKELIAWVKKVSKDAMYITSHCDGAFILAKANLLKNKSCTTFPGDIEAMKKMFPDLDIKKDVFIVHDGKIITSAGGAKSFEAALYLCELLYGAEVTRRLAQGLVIDWDITKLSHLIVSKKI